VREPLHPASAGEGVMTFAWPIRITGQVLLAPPAVDVHYRHFAGMIAHPFVICLLTSFVYSPFIATLLITYTSSSASANQKQ
jgi:hypothetical protein